MYVCVPWYTLSFFGLLLCHPYKKEVDPSKISLQMPSYYCIKLQSSKLLFSCDIHSRIASACCCQNLVFFLFSVCYIYHLGCKGAMLFCHSIPQTSSIFVSERFSCIFTCVKADTEGCLYHALFTKKKYMFYTLIVVFHRTNLVLNRRAIKNEL